VLVFFDHARCDNRFVVVASYLQTGARPSQTVSVGIFAHRHTSSIGRYNEFPSPITLCVNLWHNPTDPLKALLLAEQLRELSDAQPDTIYDLWLGNEKAGETVIVRWSDLRALPHWLFPFAFAQGELVKTLLQLYRDGVFNETYLPLCPLQQLGELGPDVRDIYDGL